MVQPLPDPPAAPARGPRKPVMLYLGEWNSHTHAALIGFGVPIFSMVMPGDSWMKATIAATVALIASLAYYYVELMEIYAQQKHYGQINPEEADDQKRSMQWLYWGATLAFVWWLVAQVGEFRLRPSYGIIEWAILVETVVLCYGVIKSVQPVISTIQQAQAVQRRLETSVAAH